ncbi:MAG: hypothetical protein ABFQ53_00435 [Patescibacteria group bacterium]
MDKILYKNIIATITYYDVLDRSLTAFEIWKHLIRYSGDDTRKIWSLTEVISALHEEAITKYVSQKNGMYFLFGREGLTDLRRKREYISIVKMRKISRIVSILRISPFVEMVCITGRLSYYNCDKESDLDVFVVYKYGHIWTGRFFLSMLTHILGVRRYGDKTNNRICLNYHVTTESMCVPTQDLFAANEYMLAIPVYDSAKYFLKFCKDNAWIQNYKPHYKCDQFKHALTMDDNGFTKFLKKALEVLFSDKGMEKRLEKFQQKKINKNPKTSQKGSLIMCSDKHLVFLPEPHGPKIFEEYKRRFDALELDF